jgi:hypothetical protein
VRINLVDDRRNGICFYFKRMVKEWGGRRSYRFESSRSSPIIGFGLVGLGTRHLTIRAPSKQNVIHVAKYPSERNHDS